MLFFKIVELFIIYFENDNNVEPLSSRWHIHSMKGFLMWRKILSIVILMYLADERKRTYLIHCYRIWHRWTTSSHSLSLFLTHTKCFLEKILIRVHIVEWMADNRIHAYIFSLDRIPAYNSTKSIMAHVIHANDFEEISSEK